MIYPSTTEFTEKNHINRYELVVATAKCARIITDDYVKQKELAEKMAGKDSEKLVPSLIKEELRDEKAVQNAINMLNSGEFRIVEQSLPENSETDKKISSDSENED